MGQPIVVIEKRSIANPGMVRFETNRAITGMGHEVYPAGTEVRGDRPPDEIARRLYAHGGIEGIHINGSVVTVDLAKGARTDGMREIIESLFIHYPPTADDPEQAVADADAPESAGEVEEQKAAAPAEVAPDPKHTDADATGADTIAPEEAAEASAVDEARSSERAGATDDPEAAATQASGADPDAESSRPPASAAARAPLDPGESPDPD
jgi:hypothetical protein